MRIYGAVRAEILTVAEIASRFEEKTALGSKKYVTANYFIISRALIWYWPNCIIVCLIREATARQRNGRCLDQSLLREETCRLLHDVPLPLQFLL